MWHLCALFSLSVHLWDVSYWTTSFRSSPFTFDLFAFFHIMSVVNRKRKVLTLEERVKAVKLSNNGESARKIAQTLGVGKTQIQSVILDKEAILKECKTGQSSTRKYLKVRKTPYEQLNKLVWERFCITQSKGVPVSGTLLQQKALMFSMQFGHNDFMALNGWLESFKLRHNIWSATLSGKAGDVSATLEADWKKRLETILEGYELKDVFNAETGVFYRDLPNKSFVVQGETCSGGKKIQAAPYLVGRIQCYWWEVEAVRHPPFAKPAVL